MRLGRTGGAGRALRAILHAWIESAEFTWWFDDSIGVQIRIGQSNRGLPSSLR